MKKLLVALLMILFANMANAENYVIFKSDVVETAINQLVSSENRQAAADEYQKNMDPETGKISVLGLYKVCIASGFNIQTNDGYSLCRNFLNFMITETENMGIGISSQQNCANQFNGVWTLSSDGTTYQCVGRDGNLLNYRKSCRDGGGTCIKQFDNLKTQGAKGREFINAYGTLKGLNFTCHANADISKLGQDYIMCSAGGNAYEFEFDSLNQSPNSTSSNSENTAICELYGGKIVNTGDKYTEDTWQSCDISSELCKGAVSSLAQRTGHSVQYQGYCRLSRGIKEVSTIFLNQIDGIDSRIFYNAGLQMRMDTAKPMVEEYLRTNLGIDKDYVISCTVGSQQVDFIFDDLSETFDNDAATGKEAMQCIINGGTFKGETCRGPTKEECEKLDAVLRSKGSDKGARYDDDARACILGNAMATYQRNVVAGYVIGAVVIVGGTVLTIASGGAAAPVVIVVINGVAMLATDIGINYAIDANHRRLSEKAAKKFVDFVTDADACTTEQCALEVLEKHYATLSGVMSDLNTDDQAVVDETMDRLIGLIQTEFVACGENDAGQTVYASPADCAMQQSKLTLLDHIDPYSEIALVIGSVIYDPGYVVTRFTRLNKITKLTNDISDAVKDVNKVISNNMTLELSIFDDVTHAQQALQSQARAASSLLVNNVDLIKNASSISEAQKYADEATQLAFILQDRADEAAALMADVSRNAGTYELTTDALRLAQQYSDNIAETAKQAQEIANQSNTALAAKRAQLNAAKESDVKAAVAKMDARRTNTREYITEPVMYFRAIEPTNKSPAEIVQILNDAGIRATTDVSDKTAWVVNRASVSADGITYELVSPFLSPETAPEQFDIVNDLLAQNGVNLRGAVTPTTISQIDPTVTTGISRDQAMSNIRKYFNDNRDMFKEMGLTDTATDDEILSTLVARNSFFNSEDNVSVMKKYTDNNVLFRGQKFSTSDETSAYANMSPKPGATGNVLASPDAVFASTYAGTGALANGGAGVSAQHVGNITVGNNRVGFLNVYSGSPKDVYYGNVGIEQLDDINPNVPLSNHNNNIPETLITPTDNPVIDRYMVVNDRYVKLDANNAEHRLIMDAMAPDLSKTYNSEMLQRIENVENEMTNGMVQTYDLPPDVINTLGG